LSMMNRLELFPSASMSWSRVVMAMSILSG